MLARAAAIRIIETTTGQTWHHVRRDLDRLHAVTFTGPTGTFRQRADPTKPQIDLYARLDLPLPKKVIEITPAGRWRYRTLEREFQSRDTLLNTVWVHCGTDVLRYCVQ